MKKNTNKREVHIVALYLAKFNQLAFTELGCNNLTEAYSQVSHALDYTEASIKHYRDFFDALLPNKRQGWKQKKPYTTVRDIFQEFDDYDFEELSKNNTIKLCDSLMKEVFSSHTHSIKVTYVKDFDDVFYGE